MTEFGSLVGVWRQPITHAPLLHLVLIVCTLIYGHCNETELVSYFYCVSSSLIEINMFDARRKKIVVGSYQVTVLSDEIEKDITGYDRVNGLDERRPWRNIKGLSQEICWLVWIDVGLNMNRFWFLSFKEAPSI